MIDKTKLYTFNEAKEMLRMGKTRLYELLKKGEIRHYKVNGKYLIAGAELEAFLKRCEA